MQPCVCVLPMGWSHALALCQGVLRCAMDAAGFAGDQCIEDGKPGVVVDAASATVGCGGRCPDHAGSRTLTACMAS